MSCFVLKVTVGGEVYPLPPLKTVTEITTPELLAEKKQEIVNYIQSFSCANATGCLYIAFGAKPCGGPREYLVYPNTVDQAVLETMVNDYYEMDQQYNIESGAFSDCMLVGPPNTVGCVNGVCTIIN